MSDEIGYGGGVSPEQGGPANRKLVSMRVGEAVVYVQEMSGSVVVERGDDIYPASPSAKEAFESANEILGECVRVVGERVANLGGVKPRQVVVEFALTFEATGKAQVIPVLLTGETKVGAGLKVTAVWGD